MVKYSPSTQQYFWDAGDGTAPVRVQVLKSPSTGRTFWQAEGGQPVEFNPSMLGQRLRPQPKGFSGTFIPASINAQGEREFDSNAGLLGLAKDITTTGRDAWEGKLNLNSEKGLRRMLDTAAAISPVGAASRVATAVRSASGKTKIPTAAELQVASDAGYKKAGEMGVEYSFPKVLELIKSVKQDLTENFKIRYLNKKLYKLLDELEKAPSDTVSIQLPLLDKFRIELRDLPVKTNSQGNAKGEALKKLDAFMSDPVASGVVVRSPSGGKNTLPATLNEPFLPNSSQAQEAIKVLIDARSNAAAKFRSDDLDAMAYKIKLSESPRSNPNTDASISNKLAAKLTGKNTARGLSDSEKEAIEQTILGGKVKNTLRSVGGNLGQMDVYRFALPIAGSAGFASGVIPDAGIAATTIIPAAIAGIGSASRGAVNKITKSQFKKLGNDLRKRSALYEKRQAEAPKVRTPKKGSAVAKRFLGQSLVSGGIDAINDLRVEPPQVPIGNDGATQRDLLRSRWLEQMKRAGIPVT